MIDGMEIRSRGRAIRARGIIMVASIFVVGVALVGSIAYVNDWPDETMSGVSPPAVRVFSEPVPIIPEIQAYSPPLLGSIENTVKACASWRNNEDGSFSMAEAARALAVCSLLTGQPTAVKAGNAAVSVDLRSVAIGFALALFLWGVLVGLGSMVRSAFRRTPQPPPRPLPLVEPSEASWRQ